MTKEAYGSLLLLVLGIILCPLGTVILGYFLFPDEAPRTAFFIIGGVLFIVFCFWWGNYNQPGFPPGETLEDYKEDVEKGWTLWKWWQRNINGDETEYPERYFDEDD